MDGKRNIPPYLIGLLVVIAIQIVGFVLLWNEITSQQQYIYLPTENKQGVTTGTQTNPVVAVTKFPTESVLRETIQSVLKQELAPYAHQLAAAPEARRNTTPADPPGVRENSPENSQALTAVTSIVSNAIAQGKWTTTDFAALLPYAHQLTTEQRHKIMNEIADAVNRQELQLETLFPLL